jgi:predicted ester cyclase
MSGDDNKRAVAEFVERCQNQHDLAFADEALRGTHLGELWDLPPTGNRVELEFIDIFRVCDGRLIEHWTSMDVGAFRRQMRPSTASE